jgi:hypothetical protein
VADKKKQKTTGADRKDSDAVTADGARRVSAGPKVDEDNRRRRAASKAADRPVKELKKKIKEEGDKVKPREALPEIRARIKAGQEKTKKTSRRDDKRGKK